MTKKEKCEKIRGCIAIKLFAEAKPKGGEACGIVLGENLLNMLVEEDLISKIITRSGVIRYACFGYPIIVDTIEPWMIAICRGEQTDLKEALNE